LRFGYQKIGGWDAVYAITDAEHFKVMKPIDDPGMPWPSVFTGVLLLGMYFWGTNQYITQRTLASKNLRQGQWGAMFAGFLKLSILFIMIFPGAFARVIYGLVLAGLIAAMMSSLDSGLNSVSTLITMDFIKKIKPDADSKSLMNTGRVVTAIVMVIAIFWAPQIGNFEKLWDYLQNTLAWFCPPIVALFVMGLFFKRTNTTGAILSIVVGFLITAWLVGLKATGSTLDLGNFLYVAFWHFLICCALLFVGSFFGANKSEAELAKVVWTREEFAAETVALRSEPWYTNYRYHGLALLILVTIILLIY